MQLRDYQQQAVEAAIESMRSGGSTLLVMATGLGKTVVFAEIIRRYMSQGTGRRALVLAHRVELIQQAAATLRRICQCDVEIEMGEQRAREDMYHRAPIVVSSVATQVARAGDQRRMHRFDASKFGIVVIDEAHHAVADSYRMTLEHYRTGRCRVLGVTATPDRADEAALGEVFETVAMDYGIREGVQAGWLVPVKQRLVSVRSLDFTACRTTAGDLNGADLDSIMRYEETLHGMVYPTIELAGDRRGVIFAASVAHADRISEILNRHRAASAISVNAKTHPDERREMFRGFSEGRYQWLVNVGVATEGWDDAALDGRGVQVIAMMRPTKSRALYCQMVGRGTRPLPGTVDGLATPQERCAAIAASAKQAVEVLDYCGNSGRHRLVHLADALAGRDADELAERAERAVARAAQQNGEAAVDVLALMDREEVLMKREAEARARRGIVVRAKYATQEINPFALIDLAPDRDANWERGVPASEKQLALLRRMRVGIPALLTRKEASRLIDAAMATPTPGQAWVLQKHGLDPRDFTRKSASVEIDRIKESGNGIRQVQG
jgi:superfamily II DNA or RNA helicase